MSERAMGRNQADELMFQAVTRGELQNVVKLVNLYNLSHPNWEGGFVLLCHAIRHYQIDIAKFLLQKGARVNTYRQVNTPLHYAALKGRVDLVGLLIHKNALIDAQNEEKRTPLHIATLRNDEITVRLLINSGADCSSVDIYGLTPLLIACGIGPSDVFDLLQNPHLSSFSGQQLYFALLEVSESPNKAIVWSLVNAGANLHSVLEYNLTVSKFARQLAIQGPSPLCFACDRGWFESVALLLERDAQVNCVRPTDSFTPLHIAAQKGHTNVAKLLLDNNAYANAKALDSVTALHLACTERHVGIVGLLLESGAQTDCIRLSDNYSPLHIAAERGFVEIVELLLKNGAVETIETRDKETPLHLACKGCHHLGTVELLLKFGAQTNCIRLPDNYTPLHIASEKGDRKLVKLLLENGADVNAEALNRATPFLLACTVYKHRSGIVQLLHKFGAQINCIRLSDNFSPLHMASEKNHSDLVKFLLENGADVNAKTVDGMSPLHIAAVKGYISVVNRLLGKCADVNTQTNNGSTALVLATDHKHTEVVKLLLKFHADVNIKNDKSESPLYLAAKSQTADLVRLIVHHRPDFDDKIAKLVSLMVATNLPGNCLNIINALCKYGFTPSPDDAKCGKFWQSAVTNGRVHIVQRLLSLSANPDDDKEDPTILHEAVKYGHIEIVKLLLSAKYDINAKDKSDNTPIFYSMTCGNAEKSAEIISLLLENGADLTEVPSLLHVAVQNKNFKACKILVENGADVNLLQKDYTPFQLCISGPFVKIYQSPCATLVPKTNSELENEAIFLLLLRNGGDKHFKTDEGYTLLHFAASHAYNESVGVLLELGLDVNARAADGSTALHLAAENGHDSIVELLLKNKALVDIQRDNHDTALLCAAARGNVSTVKVLLHFDADIDIQGSNRRTALHCAIMAKHEETIALLLNNGIDVTAEDDKDRTAVDLVTASLDLFRCSDELKRIASIFTRHILKLRAANFSINHKLEALISSDLVDHQLSLFELNCKDEIERMENEKIWGDVTLYDVLLNLENPGFARNEELVQAVGALSPDAFPIYGVLIEGHLKKNRRNVNLSTDAGMSLNSLIKTSNVFCEKKIPVLPLELLEKIINYLNDEELKRLVFCGNDVRSQCCK